MRSICPPWRFRKMQPLLKQFCAHIWGASLSSHPYRLRRVMFSVWKNTIFWGRMTKSCTRPGSGWMASILFPQRGGNLKWRFPRCAQNIQIGRTELLKLMSYDPLEIQNIPRSFKRSQGRKSLLKGWEQSEQLAFGPTAFFYPSIC